MRANLRGPDRPGNIRVEIARTPTDLGLKAACKQALDLTLGEYVVLLNNDTVVTNGWLNQLIGLASFTLGIGLAGPMSNIAAPPQLVETVPYAANWSVGFSNGSALPMSSEPGSRAKRGCIVSRPR